MKLVFTGGGMWNGIELEAAHAPQEVKLSGVIVHDQDDEGELPPSMRKTVLMSRVENQRYEIERFDGENEEVAVYVFRGGTETRSPSG